MIKKDSVCSMCEKPLLEQASNNVMIDIETHKFKCPFCADHRPCYKIKVSKDLSQTNLLEKEVRFTRENLRIKESEDLEWN